MNEEFAAHMQARLEELVAGEKFYRKRDGALVTPAVYRTQLPQKIVGYTEGDNSPHVCWAITKGAVEERVLSFTVIIVAEIWTPAGIVEGSADIERLVMALLGIANDIGFAGHRLGGVEFHLGNSSESDYGDGVQPHPLYQAQIKLQFSAPIRRKHCNR